jgi:hypothetical protein
MQLPFFTRERLIWASLVLFLLLGLYLTRSQDREKLLSAQATLQTYKDQNGLSHARIEVLEASQKELSQQADSLSHLIGIRPKTLAQYIKGDLRIDTLIKPQYEKILVHDTTRVGDTLYTDSTTRYKIHFQDSSFLSLEGTVPSKEGLQITLGAQAQVITYYKKSGWFGPRQLVADLSTNNPYLKITNAQAYVLKPPAKLRIRPGLGIGLNYNPLTHTLSPGVQAGLYLFKSR